MRNRILSITRNVIPYVKELNVVSGGVLASVAMQQLDYWFHSKPDGFYKFMGPSNHEAYRPGDSWTEELGMTVDEFRSAFDKIGIRYKSRTEYEKMVRSGGDVFQGKFYCSYVARRENLTFYFRNHELLDATLDTLIAGEHQPSRRWSASDNQSANSDDVSTHCFTEQISVDGNPHLQESGFPSTGMDIPIYRDGNSYLQELGSPSADMEIPICANGESRGPSIQRIPTDTTTTTERGCGGDLEHESRTQETLFWPHCSPEEKEAIAGLVAALPENQQQVFLDEIEGARQAGVIRTNPVAYAGGLVRAMLSGTFAVGHGASVASKRRASGLDRAERQPLIQFPRITPEDLARGQRLMDKVLGAKTA